MNLVFNYSSIVLTEAMKNLLNRGLNFAILPDNLDFTQVMADFRRFERSVTWTEYWYGRELNIERKPCIFKNNKKHNMNIQYFTYLLSLFVSLEYLFRVRVK